MKHFPLLSLLIWIPIFLGLSTMLPLLRGANNSLLKKYIVLIGSLATLALSCVLFLYFDYASHHMQFIEKYHWFSMMFIGKPVEYALGVDGISMLFIPLNCFMTFLVIWAGWNNDKYPSIYNGLFLVMCGLVNGVFAATDGFLFYLLFEASLIPFYLIIGIWGGPNKIYAAFKFFLYTVAGSIFLLLTSIYLAQLTGSFDIISWQSAQITFIAQILIFFALLFAFAIKIPMWPVHTWLPDAHVEAPTGASVMLAAIALKVGGYAMFRFLLPIVPDACRLFSPFAITLSLVSILYIAFVALIQVDMKKLVAYSSVSHMGFVTLGLFLFDELGFQGALFQMISHGFISAAMFFSIGVLYERSHTRMISDYSGVINKLPYFSAFALLFFMGNCGLPGTSGFVGEFMVILAAVKRYFEVDVLVSLSLIIGAAYTLWMYKRVYFGAANDLVNTLSEVTCREMLIFIVLALAVILSGINPKPLTDIMHSSLVHLLDQSKTSKLMVGE